MPHGLIAWEWNIPIKVETGHLCRNLKTKYEKGTTGLFENSVLAGYSRNSFWLSVYDAIRKYGSYCNRINIYRMMCHSF